MLSGALTSLGVIEYEKSCVDYYKLMLPYSFSWTRDSWVCYGSCSSSSSSSSSDEEYCYAYGTTVVRRTAEEKNETVPIEAVKEGDFILAKGTQGLFFTEAIVVDLHPASNSGALTLTTKSGQRITLTGEHMTLVHDAHKPELVPARLVRPGSQVEVTTGDGLTMLDEVIDVSPADPSSVKGLANIHTGAETIVVNGVVGSTLSENSTRTLARRIARRGLHLLNSVAGPNVTRHGYRMAEWLMA